MSYRYRFIKVKKDIAENCRNMSPEEFIAYVIKNIVNHEMDDDDRMPCVFNMFAQEEIFDFGSDFDHIEETHNSSERFFIKDELNDWYEDYDIRFCTEDTILAIIEGFRKKIETYFRKIAEGPEHKKKGYFEQKIDEWSKFTDNVENNYTEEQKEKVNRVYYPYNLNDKDKLVNSWLYEYEIFELVFIFKTFDWENHSLLFYGW